MSFIFQKIPPARIVLMFVTISTWLIMSALFMQVFFEIRPCHLCLWQRYPHFIVMFGAVLVPLRIIRPALFLQGLAYLSGAGLSLYHTGIERKWWQGLAGCTSSDMSNLSIAEIQAKILNTAIVKCDEISWSLFGLTLSNYNLIICFLLMCIVFYCIKGYDKYAK